MRKSILVMVWVCITTFAFSTLPSCAATPKKTSLEKRLKKQNKKKKKKGDTTCPKIDC